MRTFGEIRTLVLSRAGTPGDHFAFCRLTPKHGTYWDRINEEEYQRGYDPLEYLKKGTPALNAMKLLTDEEFERWLRDFEALPGLR